MKRMKLAPLAVLAGVLGLTACTKALPYKYVYKEQTTEKSVIDESADYLYVASNLEASRTSPAARPFAMASEKIVRLKFTEKSLDVIEQEKDGRFAANPTNDRVLLSIPVQHQEFRCRKDKAGECTNEEEEASDIPWNAKTKFKPDFDGLNVKEVSVLPVEIENLLGGSCYRESGQKLLSYELANDAVNIRLERTFSVDINCAEELESLSDLSFSAVYHYSMVKLSSLASPDYKVIAYPGEDEGTFGFFTTELKKLDADNLDLEDGIKVLMNRWNPGKKELVYLLSDNLLKPENAAIKRATEIAIEHVNAGLEKAGAGLRVVLKAAEGRPLGDLRLNSIVMVEDPLAAGVIGYGPSAANPRTGEIVSGRVVMYLGTIKKFMRMTYDEFVQREKAKLLAPNVNEKPSIPESEGPVGSEGMLSPEALAGALQPRKLERSLSERELERITSQVSEYKKNTDMTSKAEDKLGLLADRCFYSSEMVNFEEAVERGLKEIAGSDLKPWSLLSEAEKNKILDILVPFVWVPTLVHEMGHNLGLRHNFAGSEDKTNFFSQAELTEMGIKRPITYSSVMDYSYNNLNELPAMGKYDVAALRFGYERKVEVFEKGGTEPRIVPVPENLGGLQAELKLRGAKLKPYKFCTDEHVGPNLGCRRFDEGTSYTEIAKHLVKASEERYVWRNFRNKARSFSLLQDGQYFSGALSRFKAMRVFFEAFERISEDFNVPDELWGTNPFLKDLRDAADLAVAQSINVLTTPDTMCLVTTAESIESGKPGPVQAIPISVISSDAISCSSADVQETLAGQPNPLVAIGQGGKFFQSRKDPDSSNPYVDQIDVRGIWMDKLAAAHFLMTRSIGMTNFDRHQGSPLTMERWGPSILGAVTDILLDQPKASVTFTLNDGKKAIIPLRVKLASSHVIRKPLVSGLAKAMGMPEGEVPFNDQLLRTIVREVPSAVHDVEAKNLLALFGVRTSVPAGMNAARFEAVDIGTTRFFALKQNVLALQAIRGIKAHRLLSQLEPAEILEVVKRIAEKLPPPAGATAVEKEAQKLPIDIIAAFVTKKLPSEAHLSKLLSSLAEIVGGR